MNLPNLLYLFLAVYLPQNLFFIGGSVFAEQFGYGLGFSSYMMYLIFASKGEFKTAFYAICTGFMALGLQLPGAVSGYLKDSFGFVGFFEIAMLATLVSFFATFCAEDFKRRRKIACAICARRISFSSFSQVFFLA